MPPAFNLDFGKEVNPTGFVFLHALSRTEHLAVTVFVDRDGCKGGDILLFAAPVAAQINAVHISIRIAATLQRAVALVACCLCQFLGILLQQPVRSFFDAAAHQFFQLPLANSSLNCTIFSDITCLLFSECFGVVTSFYQSLQDMSCYFSILHNLLYFISIYHTCINFEISEARLFTDIFENILVRCTLTVGILTNSLSEI